MQESSVLVSFLLELNDVLFARSSGKVVIFACFVYDVVIVDSQNTALFVVVSQCFFVRCTWRLGSDISLSRIMLFDDCLSKQTKG